eukprot:5112333-Ditylum_brightwellii.AAC.1
MLQELEIKNDDDDESGDLLDTTLDSTIDSIDSHDVPDTNEFIMEEEKRKAATDPRESHSKYTQSQTTKFTKSATLFQTLLLELPILLLFVLLLITLSTQHLYATYYTPLLQNLNWIPKQQERQAAEATYYNR